MRLSLQLAPPDPAELRARADAVADPDDPHHGAHLDRPALAERVARTAEARAALRDWLAAAGLDARAGGLGEQRLHAAADLDALARLLGPAAARELRRRRVLVGEAARACAPAPLAAQLLALELGPWREPDPPRRLDDPGGPAPTPPATGMTPAALARGYELGPDADGEGETVALMALGGVPDPADLHGFARAFGLPAPRVELVPLTPLGDCADDPRFRFETTMGAQWLAATAPRARIAVYLIDPAIAADPWSAFLLAVLSDMSRAPSIALTTWSAPARQYAAVHGGEVFAGLLDQAALAGISVVAASGDWGAYDGFPSAGPSRSLCDELAARVTFPGVEPRVLSVGGTHVRRVEPWDEVAWSAPVSPALRAAIGLGALAGGGGVSERISAPAYQRPWLPASFPRGAGLPPLPARGRVQPDVSLMAWGETCGARPTAYACLLGGEFRDDAGGTSVAAPVWAGVLARLNQLRRRRGLPRLGQVHPLLYAACARDPALLRDIGEGCTDIALPIAGPDGAPRWETLPGFRAIPGLDPATGLGVPRVARLERTLAAPLGTETSP